MDLETIELVPYDNVQRTVIKSYYKGTLQCGDVAAQCRDEITRGPQPLVPQPLGHMSHGSGSDVMRLSESLGQLLVSPSPPVGKINFLSTLANYKKNEAWVSFSIH